MRLEKWSSVCLSVSLFSVNLINNLECAFVRYTEEMIPLHPCLQIISNCEQTLSSHTSRRLITMEKIKEPEVCAFYSFNRATQFKHKFMCDAPTSTTQSYSFHPQFLACVVLCFYCQQCHHRCSLPTCALYRMFTVFSEHEQETCMMVKWKHVFAFFLCLFYVPFKQWCLYMEPRSYASCSRI